MSPSDLIRPRAWAARFRVAAVVLACGGLWLASPALASLAPAAPEVAGLEGLRGLDPASLEASEVFGKTLGTLRTSGQWPSDDRAIDREAERLTAASTGTAHVGMARHSIGTVRLQLGRFADAEADLRTALSLIDALPPTLQLASIQNNLGISIAQQGRLAEAMDFFVASDATRRALGEPDDPGLLGNIAALNLLSEDWARARQYGERALAAVRVAEMPPIQALSTLGSAHVGLGDYAAARALFEEALALPEASDAAKLGPANNLGYALLKLGNLDEALQQMTATERLAASIGDQRTVAIVRKNMGEVWIAKGDRPRAQQFLEAALAAQPADAQPRKRAELLDLLSENLEALGRPAEALKTLREQILIEGELLNAETKARMETLEATLQLRARDAEVARQQAEIAGLEERSRRENLERYGLLALVLAMVTILLLLIRHVRERARVHGLLLERNQRIEAQHQQLETLNALVRRQSEEDPLTGLHNRRHLQDVLAALAAQVPPEPALAIVADLDFFKRINDTWGHEGGDIVLKHVATVMRGCARRGDTLVRWGGEEFVWVCRGARAEDGPRICESLRAALAANPVMLNGQAVVVTASLGFAPMQVWRDEVPMPDLALRLADHAAYRAKRGGRDRWAGYVGRDAPKNATNGPETSVQSLEDGGWVEAISSGV